MIHRNVLLRAFFFSWRVSRRNFPGGSSRNGFTLVEIALVLVIIALILGLGVSAYMGLMETRKVGKARSLLSDAKSCLFKRVLVSERYPSYTTGLTCAGGGSSAIDVDDCICPAAMDDPWGGGILFLEGMEAPGAPATGLAGKPIVSQIVRGQTRVAPDSSSAVRGHKGVVQDDVAFVLISFGEDTAADSASYGTPLAGVRAAVMGGRPDFQTGHVDDIYLVVTSSELVTYLLE